MIIDILMLVAGLVLILGGANYMTDGSAAIAKKLGMSDFIVGLTIVSMMTSAPELVVSVMSAANASTEMAIGNIVGSNIFNILVIIGVVALVKPITVSRGVLVSEIPLVVLSSAVLLTMGSSPYIDAGGPMVLTRVDGILLLFFFIIFMRHTISSARSAGPDEPVSADGARREPIPMPKALLMLFGGLGALILGGNWFVDGASGLARALGWSDALIGLTILAAGTSLPELATSVAAAAKGYPGLCLGNVIGSCIFNIFFVLGVTATVMPLEFGAVGIADLLTLTGASVMFWLAGRFYRDRTITRPEGAVMLLAYVGYMVYLYLNLPENS